jgi:hypothetical protein
VNDLHRQAIKCGQPFEILLMDDASQDEYRRKNSAIKLPYLRYIQLTENAGRSKIRNRLCDAAQYPYLIFIDCDSAVYSADYIANYIPFFKPDIVCYGGCIYNDKMPDEKKYLRWKYGKKRESLPVWQREKEPNFSFKSGNFLIYKNLLKKNPFNEDLSEYGHEDTFLGIQLLGEGIFIQQIDNPLIHLGLEDSEIFIAKTEKALVNLKIIDGILQKKYPEYVKHSRLVRIERNLKKLRLNSLVAFIVNVFKPIIKKNLLGKHPSILLFDVYKLGIYSSKK